MQLQDSRANLLVSYGANSQEVEELLVYNENVFDCSCFDESIQFPLPSELHVATWKNNLEEARRIGVFSTLQQKLLQLRFPVSPVISLTPAYQAATRKGKFDSSMNENSGLILHEPEKLRLIVHSSLAGEIPVIIVDNRCDFVKLVQALTMRNEPQHIPDSMGACMIGGFNNWDRIRLYREQWQVDHPHGTEADWNVEFRKLIPRKELYQDRFIILSRSSYSNVSAEKLGLSETEWLEISLAIRLEHECTHYLTKRLFGSMRNNLLDEFIADYQGICAAIGSYREDWFLNFMGLESFPNYRQGGRLENYRDNLSPGSFDVMQKLIFNASKNLNSFVSGQRNNIDSTTMVMVLCQLTLEELASDNFSANIFQVLDKVGEIKSKEEDRV